MMIHCSKEDCPNRDWQGYCQADRLDPDCDDFIDGEAYDADDVGWGW